MEMMLVKAELRSTVFLATAAEPDCMGLRTVRRELRSKMRFILSVFEVLSVWYGLRDGST